PVVARFALPVVPHPMPAVRKAVGVERPLGCGPEPESVVSPRRHGRVSLMAKVGPRTADPGPRMGDLAEFARANQFCGPGQAGTAAALRPQLDHAAIFAGGLDHASPLVETMRGGFFHVHVLASLTGPNRG